MAALAAAWRLSGEGAISEVTIYQRGWRLGGKGASSRGESKAYISNEYVQSVIPGAKVQCVSTSLTSDDSNVVAGTYEMPETFEFTYYPRGMLTIVGDKRSVDFEDTITFTVTSNV